MTSGISGMGDGDLFVGLGKLSLWLNRFGELGDLLLERLDLLKHTFDEKGDRHLDCSSGLLDTILDCLGEWDRFLARLGDGLLDREYRRVKCFGENVELLLDCVDVGGGGLMSGI